MGGELLRGPAFRCFIIGLLSIEMIESAAVCKVVLLLKGRRTLQKLGMGGDRGQTAVLLK